MRHAWGEVSPTSRASMAMYSCDGATEKCSSSIAQVGAEGSGLSLTSSPRAGVWVEALSEAGQGPPFHLSDVPCKVICSLLPPGKMTRATPGSHSTISTRQVQQSHRIFRTAACNGTGTSSTGLALLFLVFICKSKSRRTSVNWPVTLCHGSP